MIKDRDNQGGFEMKLKSLLLILFLGAMCFSVYAQNFRNVTAEELKKMVDRRAKMAIVDARSEEEYKLGHVTGAVNVPGYKLYLLDRLLPKNKKTPIIIYCRGGA
jgi:predicted sulfurtransferase